MVVLKRFFEWLNHNKRALISWTLLVSWMILIFILSAQDADDSSETSGSILAAILNIIYPGFKLMNPIDRFIILELYQGIIRKLAHFTIFGILGGLAVNAYRSLKIQKNSHVAVLAFVTCVIYATLDEIHQIFVPGRSCEAMDIIIDSSGSLLFIALSILIIVSIERKKKSIQGNP